MSHAIRGVFSAAATPVDGDGHPDHALFTAHCRALLDEGCHGIALLGTTGEANSFGLAQRQALLDAAIESGIAAGRLLPGTAAPSVADTLALTRHAVAAGVGGCVLLPPYYYKDVDDEGLFRFYARVIDGVGDERLRVVLYHIPQLTRVPISDDLVERLMTAYPGIVCAIKDSAGDLDHMVGLCQRFADLAVLAGADPLLLPLLRAGGAGCITATSNLRADALRVVWDGWRDPARAAEVEAAQQRIVAWRKLSNRYAQLATIKAMLAARSGNPAWRNLAPPLLGLDEARREDIEAAMRQLGD